MLKGVLDNIASSAQGSAQGAAQQELNKAASSSWVKYYLLIFAFGIVISATGFIAPKFPQLVFTVNTIIFLALGFWHWSRVRRMAVYQTNFVSFLLKITFLTLLFIMIGYVLAYFLLSKFMENIFCDLSMIGMLSSSVLASLIPTASALTFESIAAIPPKDFKKWIYPEKPIIMDENTDLSNFVLITFVFAKKHGDKEKSNLQSKGPYGIKLGDLFYFFVQEWNYRNPEKQIQYLDENNRPFGWYFTAGKSFWSGKKYLDPELTIKDNNIKINLIIDTERVIL
ncbi:MAG: TssN family type VI secretion system protein [Bacteroidota bacterium]|jgi:hypothetical protein